LFFIFFKPELKAKKVISLPGGAATGAKLCVNARSRQETRKRTKERTNLVAVAVVAQQEPHHLREVAEEEEANLCFRW
jgi:hypothetical protein